MKSSIRTNATATCILAALVAAAALAQDGKMSEADGGSTLRWELTLDATLDEAWDAFTTKERWESWAVPVCEADFRVGGTIKTNYDKNAGIGGPGTIVHHILAIEPKRMYSSRVTAPENASAIKAVEKSWGVVRFDPVGPARTRVTLVSCGYGQGPEWDAARKFFEKGNEWSLQQLRKKFAKDRAASRLAAAEIVIAAPVADVWRAWTTEDALASWFAPVVKLELRNDGVFHSHADSAAKIGDPDTQCRRILSYEPERMLAFTAAVPIDDERISPLSQVVRLTPEGDARTRVTLTTVGFNEGEKSAALVVQAESENEALLQSLQARLDKPVAHKDAFDLIQSWVGGAWIVDNQRPDGSKFRALSIYEHGPGAQSVVARGWIGNADALMAHGATQVFRDPADGVVRFQNIDERGSITRGDIQLIDGRTLVWDWRQTSAGGKVSPYRVHMVQQSPSRLSFKVELVKSDTEASTLVETEFRRVLHAPADFQRSIREDAPQR